MQYINDRNEDLENIKFNLKIHSKDRNLELQKNPFSFRINFNPFADTNLYKSNKILYMATAREYTQTWAV